MRLLTISKYILFCETSVQRFCLFFSFTGLFEYKSFVIYIYYYIYYKYFHPVWACLFIFLTVSTKGPMLSILFAVLFVFYSLYFSGVFPKKSCPTSSSQRFSCMFSSTILSDQHMMAKNTTELGFYSLKIFLQLLGV